ncbi:MAG: glucose-6-phosphate isomerase [Pseudobdellovibrionaceae bacterium]
MIHFSSQTKALFSVQQIQSEIEKLKTLRNQGFLSLHQGGANEALWNSSFTLAEKFRNRFQKLVICGIGGSSLGFESFQQYFHFDQVIVLDNVETSTIEFRLKGLDLNQLAWTFISKSGGTIETLSTFDWMIEHYEQKQISWKDRVAVITENKASSLKNFAVQNNLPCLEVPLNVGGRYSVFSPVGLFPLFFCGVLKEQVRSGIEAALQNEKFLIQFVSELMASFERREWITSFWFYSSRCQGLGRWISQLWAESLSKAKDREGRQAPRVSTPLWMIGACDQHSLLQQWMEGERDKFVIFMKMNSPMASQKRIPKILKPRFPETALMKNKNLDELLRIEANATQKALSIQGVSTLEICLQPESLEELVEFKMLMMMSVGILGEILNLNAFDQPGVELGKVLTQQMLIDQVQ